MVRKGSKLLPFDGTNINVFQLNAANVNARREKDDDDATLIYALLENMNNRVLEVVTLWAGEGITYEQFVKKVMEYYCPQQPRSHLRAHLKNTKPTASEKAQTYMSRLCSVVRSEGYEVEKEWPEIDQRLYEALLFPVASSLPPSYFSERKDGEYKKAVNLLVEHLEQRQHGTGARIWYTAGSDATADRTYGSGGGRDKLVEPERNAKVKTERDHIALRRLAGAVNADSDGYYESLGAVGYRDASGGNDVPTCSYCGKKGHAEDVCLKRLAHAVDNLTKRLDRIAPVANVNEADFREEDGAQH